jgi:pyrimidine deaminase RibD-like protein
MRKMTIEEHYMKEAIRQAKKAAALKEVPIGCVIVYDGRIIARGYNRRTVDKNVLAHAEIIAMRKACRILGDWRGLYDVRDLGAMSDVRRSHRSGENSEGGDRLHEPKSRLCRICARHAPRGRIQPPGGDESRTVGRGMLTDAEGFL